VRPRRFPALVNCTVIDWFHPWPEDALLSVARRFLSEVDLGSDAVRDGIVRFMPYAFKCVNEVSQRYLEVERRFNYTTPKSFLGVIDLYKSMLSRRRNDLTRAIDRLQSGLEKLIKTSKDVSILEEELKVKSVEVEEKKEQADAFAETVGQEKTKVEAENDRAALEQQKCEKIAVEVNAQRAECVKQLAEAEPAVKRAEAALDTVTKKDLGETKALKTPPPGIEDITAAVIVLLSDKKGVSKDRSWKAAVQVMNQVDKFLLILRGFKNEIDAGNVPAPNFAAVRPYLALPHFKAETIRNKSKACAGLCEWVVNIVEYYGAFLLALLSVSRFV
jgi:dynein heavy chain